MTDPGDDTVEFSVSYEGDALKQHTMAVRDLAPALLALGQAFDRANSILNGDRASVNLEIKATTEGSFEVNLLLVQLLDNSGPPLAPDFLSSAQDLVKTIIGIPAAGVSLFQLLKLLRGRKPKKVEEREGAVAIEAENLRISVPAPVFRLFQDAAIRIQLEAVVHPVTKPGIDRLVFREQTETIEEIEKDDIGSFILDVGGDESESVTETIIPRERLKIISVNFEQGSWLLNDGDKTRWYSIRDKTFMQEVQDGVRSFRKGDILVCQVIMTQRVDSDGKLRLTYEIADVLKQESAPRQMSLGEWS